MQILVNQERLDYDLEDESSLGEVIDELAAWLQSGKFAITSFDINDTTFAIHDRSSWQDIELSDVRELSVEAIPLAQADHATLIALDECCYLVTSALEQGNRDLIEELAEELPYVQRRLARFFPSLASTDGAISFCSDPDLEAGRLPGASATEDIIREIADLRTLIASREREYREPERELALSLGQLAGMTDLLIEVPVQLQTGAESAAMRTIITLTELMARVVRLVPMVVPGERPAEIDMAGVRRFTEDILPQLTELKEAFEVLDSVLIGDLLEYEIAPRLERLAELLPRSHEET